MSDQGGSGGSGDPEALTAEQRARIERNRQKALLLKQSKQKNLSTAQLNRLTNTGFNNRVKDSKAGFLIEAPQEPSTSSQPSHPEDLTSADCNLCGEEFVKSFLRNNFELKICDSCRDQEVHDLITRTESKSEYLLKDCDLDKREPPLKFLLRKNPHEKARGDMKLYLRLQVEQRALEVWGTEEELEAEHERRSGKRRDRSQKAYQKQLKQLRMNVRSSLYTRQTASHVHEYGEPVLIDEDRDLYEKTCAECGHVVSYEEM